MNVPNESIRSSRIDGVDHAVGKLIQLLSVIDPPDEARPEISFSDFSSWFYDRFHVQAGACSSKTLGDAMAFAIRYGLTRVRKVSRGKAKVVTYTGIDVPTLQGAYGRLNGTQVIPRLVLTANPVDGDGCTEGIPEAPWDAGIDRTYGPTAYLEAVIEEMELDLQDMYSHEVPNDEQF